MDSCPRKEDESGFFREVWKAHNRLIDYCRSIAVMPSGSRGVQVQRTSNGTLLKAEAGEEAAEPGKIKRFILHSIQDDYITCVDPGGDTETKIAKPYDLQKSPWDGVAVNYEIESIIGSQQVVVYRYVTAIYRIANESEHQGIRPLYDIGRTNIFAMECENGTGVFADVGQTDPIKWVDLNLDARAWAKIFGT